MQLIVRGADFTVNRETEQVRAELAQRLSDQSRIVECVLSSITDFAYIFDRDGRFSFANKPLLDLWGLTLDQAVGKNFFDLNYPADLAEKLQFQIQEVIRTGETLTDETPYTNPAGIPGFYQYIFSAVAGPDGRINAVAGSTRDITARKNAELALIQSEERYRALFNSMEQGFCVIEVLFDDAERAIDYRFLEVNPVFEKHSGLKDVVGKRMRELAPNHDEHWFELYGKIVKSGERAHIVNVATALQGRWFEVYAFRLGGPGSVKVAIFFSDITERRRNEEELKTSNQRKDEFLATLSHELRNPLAPIRNGLKVMQLAKHDEKTVEQARAMIERQVMNMVRLVDDLLDVSRISQGKLVLKKEPVKLETVINSAIETSLPLIKALGHEFSVTMPPETVCLNADCIRLAQAISNLLNNAAKYTKSGGSIQLNAYLSAGDIALSVKDSGIGIPIDMLGSIFNMFTQVDRSLERSQGGLGIGLMLVRTLVEMHGGSVTAISEGEGRGSEFIIRLPTVPQCNVVLDPAECEPQTKSNRRRILVVDDNVDSAESLKILLDLNGNEVQMVHDGREAIVSAQEFKPDVILLDIGLPIMNGYDVCREIRQQAHVKIPVIVACTGWGMAEDRQLSKEAGFNLHMVKPIDLDALEKILAEMD